MDAALALDLAVCWHMRVPHSVFLGWSQSDRDKALWWYIRQGQACKSCGTRPAEWDPTQGGHAWAYVAEPRRCRGCEVRAAAQDSLTGDEGRGVHVVLTRNLLLTEPTPTPEGGEDAEP